MDDKLYITLDDVEIVDYLIDAGIEITDRNKHRIFTFFYNDSYHLVLFLATMGDKGFVMFRIDDIRENLKELARLKLKLHELMETGYDIEVMKNAMSQVELIETAGFSGELFKKMN